MTSVPNFSQLDLSLPFLFLSTVDQNSGQKIDIVAFSKPSEFVITRKILEKHNPSFSYRHFINQHFGSVDNVALWLATLHDQRKNHLN